MKIYIKTEMNKGYITSDKVNHKNIPFELFELHNFIGDSEFKAFQEDYDRDKLNKLSRTELIKLLIEKIRFSELFKKIEKEGYHTHLYLNINKDGVDCFISR